MRSAVPAAAAALLVLALALANVPRPAAAGRTLAQVETMCGTTLGKVLEGTYIVGGDLPDGAVPGRTVADCCNACATRNCSAFVLTGETCILKGGSVGLQRTAAAGMTAWAADAAVSGGINARAQPEPEAAVDPVAEDRRQRADWGNEGGSEDSEDGGEWGQDPSTSSDGDQDDFSDSGEGGGSWDGSDGSKGSGSPDEDTDAPEPAQPVAPQPEQQGTSGGPTCTATVAPGVELTGGDLPTEPWMPVTSLAVCCAECAGRADCAAFNFAPHAAGSKSGICHFKGSQGWTARPAEGKQSGVVATTGGPTLAAISTAPPPSGYAFTPLDSQQLRRVYQLTSVFETGESELQYGYATRPNNRRGVLYGYVPFSTGGTDGLAVAEVYAERAPSNPLAPFLPALRNVAGKGDDFTGLDGFEDVVKGLGSGFDFIAAQEAVCNTSYTEPAMRWCRQIGCTQPITKGQLFDALLQHGEGAGAWTIDALVEEATKTAGGTPLSGTNEVAWLTAFLEARHNLLQRYDEAAKGAGAGDVAGDQTNIGGGGAGGGGSDVGGAGTQAAKQSAKRVAIYQKLLMTGNLELAGPIYMNVAYKGTQAGWQIVDAYYGEVMVFEAKDGKKEKQLMIA